MINFQRGRELQDLKWNSVKLLSMLEKFCSLGMDDPTHEHLKGADWLESSWAKQPLGPGKQQLEHDSGVLFADKEGQQQQPGLCWEQC